MTDKKIAINTYVMKDTNIIAICIGGELNDQDSISVGLTYSQVSTLISALIAGQKVLSERAKCVN